MFWGGLLELHPEQPGGVAAAGGGKTAVCEAEASSAQDWVCFRTFNVVDDTNAFPADLVIYLPTRNVAGLPAPACPRTWVADCSDPAARSGGPHRTPSALHVLVLNGAECLFAAHQPRGHAAFAVCLPEMPARFPTGFLWYENSSSIYICFSAQGSWLTAPPTLGIS